MSEKNAPREALPHGAEEKHEDERELYVPPRMVGEELFEVLALSCGKVNPTTLGCITVPRLS